MGISFRGTVTSFNARFLCSGYEEGSFCSYWFQRQSERLCCALVGTSAVRALRIRETDRLRSASGGKNAPHVFLERPD